MNIEFNKFLEHDPQIQKMFDNWVKENYPDMIKKTEVKYKWVCHSDDGYFEDSEKDHHKIFDSQEECYDDMREAAIHKIFLNTEWNDVISDVVLDDSDPDLIKTTGKLERLGVISKEEEHWGIGYRMSFHPQKIQHYSYSGLYTYEIVKI